MKYLTSKEINLLPPKKGGHKGDNGRVLIIGGSMDYVGAPYLSGIAALRICADYVVVACPKKVGWAINRLSPDLITKKFECEYFTKNQAKEVLKFSEKFDAVLIGNGLSDRKETLEFAKIVITNLNKIQKPLVIDADALKIVDISKLENAILTPHKKEYETLLKNSKFKDIKKLIGTNIIIKKGPVDEIITKEKTYYNKTGCDRMAVAGTGDILAGLAVGLLAKGLKPKVAAKAAVFISGRLGEQAKKHHGNNFIASDLLNLIKKM